MYCRLQLYTPNYVGCSGSSTLASIQGCLIETSHPFVTTNYVSRDYKTSLGRGGTECFGLRTTSLRELEDVTCLWISMISSAIIRPIFPAPALVPPGIPGTVGWVLFRPPTTKESESEKGETEEHTLLHFKLLSVHPMMHLKFNLRAVPRAVRTIAWQEKAQRQSAEEPNSPSGSACPH